MCNGAFGPMLLRHRGASKQRKWGSAVTDRMDDVPENRDREEVLVAFFSGM